MSAAADRVKSTISTKKIHRRLALFGLLLALPATAFADAGTPLMWTAAMHLFFGNAVIGIAEGLLISLVFHTKKRSAILIMILANYCSMIGGMMLIPSFYEMLNCDRQPLPFTHLPAILWEMALLTFVATLILEWLFCLWIFSRQKNALKKSILANLLAQSASYAVLVPLYLYSSIGVGLVKDLQVDQTVVTAQPERGTIYFIAPDGVSLRAVDLNGRNERIINEDLRGMLIHGSGATMWGYGAYRLALLPASPKMPHDWNLWFRSDERIQPSSRSGKSNPPDCILLSHLSGESAVPQANTHYGKYYPADFRSKQARSWDVYASTYWVMSDLRASHPGKKGYSFFVETPFMRWDGRCPTVLPEDRMIFEFNNQILLLDLNKRKIGFIAFGKQPVVLLK